MTTPQEITTTTTTTVPRIVQNETRNSSAATPPSVSHQPQQHPRIVSTNALDATTSKSSCMLRLIQHLQTALDNIMTSQEPAASAPNVATDQQQEQQRHIESMADFIYTSMSASARNYHHVQHVFDVVGTNIQGPDYMLDPTAVLAALFHDCVYAHVDEGGVSATQRDKLQGSMEETTCANGSVRLRIPLRDPSQPEDRLLTMVQRIFGILPQQYLDPHKGQNEYLSAVIAVRELSHVPGVTDAILLQISACIEATIPFRTGDSLDVLYQRVRDASQAMDLHLTDEECVQAVQRSTLVANEDVGGFALLDHQLFMDRTWSLLPETNQALRGPSYSIFEFHAAVYKMHQFFVHGLDPQRIFHQFHGVPSTERLVQMTQAAEENVKIGTRYVAAKLVGVAFLASFAVLTGGDAPIQLFMGKTTAAGGGMEDAKAATASSPKSLADRLQSPKKRLKVVVEATDDEPKAASTDADADVSASTPSAQQWSDPEEAQVYKLLTEGRHSETTFDLRQSPLSTYFYTVIGDAQIRGVLESVGATFPMTEAKAKDFLTHLPTASVRDVATLMADVAADRRDIILQVVRDICGE